MDKDVVGEAISLFKEFESAGLSAGLLSLFEVLIVAVIMTLLGVSARSS